MEYNYKRISASVSYDVAKKEEYKFTTVNLKCVEKDSLIEELKKYEYDIIFLQELHNVEVIDQLQDYKFLYNKGKYHEGLLVKTATSFSPHEDKTAPDEINERQWTVVLKTKTGHNLVAISWNGRNMKTAESYIDHLYTFAKRMSKKHSAAVVIAGDFNFLDTVMLHEFITINEGGLLFRPDWKDRENIFLFLDRKRGPGETPITHVFIRNLPIVPVSKATPEDVQDVLEGVATSTLKIDEIPKATSEDSKQSIEAGDKETEEEEEEKEEEEKEKVVTEEGDEEEKGLSEAFLQLQTPGSSEDDAEAEATQGLLVGTASAPASGYQGGCNVCGHRIHRGCEICSGPLCYTHYLEKSPCDKHCK